MARTRRVRVRQPRHPRQADPPDRRAAARGCARASPTHLSFNGGGNDILRPRADVEAIADLFSQVLRRCDEEGVSLILLSGANPTGQLPMGRVMSRRGDALEGGRASHRRPARPNPRAQLVRRRARHASLLVGGSPAHELSRHHRVAARVLDAVGVPRPEQWWNPPELPDQGRLRGARYYRESAASQAPHDRHIIRRRPRAEVRRRLDDPSARARRPHVAWSACPGTDGWRSASSWSRLSRSPSGGAGSNPRGRQRTGLGQRHVRVRGRGVPPDEARSDEGSGAADRAARARAGTRRRPARLDAGRVRIDLDDRG